MSRSRLWKIRLSFQCILDRGHARGSDLLQLIGHYSWAVLLRRELLSIFHSVYAFINAHYHDRADLWPEVCSEMRAFAGAMVFLVAPWDLPWNEVAVCTDACETGFGIATSRMAREDVARIGRLPERDR